MLGSCEHGNETWGYVKGKGNFLTSCMTISFWRRTQLHGGS